MPNTTIGHILKQPLTELWNEHPLMKMFKTREGINCKCPPEYEGVCGGCRARAYQYFGNFYGTNPGCIYNKNLYYNFMEKYKIGEKFELEEEKENKTISVKEAV